MKKTIRRIEKKKPVRYGAVSAVSTGLDVGIYALLTLGGLHAIAANFLSTTAGFCVSFFVNRSYTFDTTEKSVRRQVILFTIVTLFGLWVIQPGVILLFKYIYSDNLSWSVTLIAKLTAMPITMVYNYFLYSRVVFKDKDKTTNSNQD